MKRFLFRIVCLFALTVCSFPALGQRSFTAIDSPIFENFDTLASTGSDLPFTDNVTLSGWYTTRPFYTAGTGSGNGGTHYSFGTASSQTERALGSVASANSGNILYGLRIRNDTGTTITSLDVAYVGEQWRKANNAAAHSLTFDYSQAASISDLTGIYTPLTSLNFTTPVFEAIPPTALNGNLAANRVSLAATITVRIPPGEEIMLRWTDTNDPDPNHGLAIDDLVIIPRRVPTAAAVSVSGSVRTASGLPIRNASVRIFGGDLSEPVTVATGSFGLFSFNGLRAGQTYFITVSAGRYSFAEPVRTVVPMDNVDDLDFVAN